MEMQPRVKKIKPLEIGLIGEPICFQEIVG